MGFRDFHLYTKARIWPWLPYVCHIRSTAGGRAVGRGEPRGGAFEEEALCRERLAQLHCLLLALPFHTVYQRRAYHAYRVWLIYPYTVCM